MTTIHTRRLKDKESIDAIEQQEQVLIEQISRIQEPVVIEKLEKKFVALQKEKTRLKEKLEQKDTGIDMKKFEK